MRTKLFNFAYVPNLFSGLFVLLAANLCFAQNFEVGVGGGILLHAENENASFWNAKIFYENARNFENEFRVFKIYSDIPWISTEFCKIDYSAKFDFDFIDPKIAAGFINSSDIEVLSGKTKITNEGLNGFFLASSLGFEVGKFEITPSFLFMKTKFEKGDFNYFYGKPDIPSFLHLGLSAEYEKTHKFDVFYQNLSLDLLNNKEMELFACNGYILGTNYKYSLIASEKKRDFYAFSGLAYAAFSADGSLTPANQQYFLFPYAFFNINGTAEAFVAWTGFSFEIRRKYLKHNFNTTIIGANIFDVDIDIHFKNRKFFGTDETLKAVDEIDFDKAALVLFTYSLESPDLKVRDRVRICFGFRKTLPIVWVNSKKVNSFSEIAGETNLAKSLLLTGLSGYLSIVF